MPLVCYVPSPLANERFAMNRSAPRIGPRLCLVWAFAYASLVGCGRGAGTPGATVVFPTSRPDQADHCMVVLRLRLGQLQGITGDGRLSKKMSGDYEHVLQAASLEVARSKGVLRSFEEAKANVQRTMKSFDQDGDGRVTLQGKINEMGEFNRHVDLCVEKFGSR